MTTFDKKAIILMNLGSPVSPKVRDVKKYLKEFLMDEKVIDLPFFRRYLLVRGIIVPFRSPKSSKAYHSIWWDEGSPLIVLTKRLQAALAEHINLKVEIAMRYGNPTPLEAFTKLVEKNKNIEEVVLLPMYPHYAMSSYETAVEYAMKIHSAHGFPFSLKIIPPYYDDPRYIFALEQSIRDHLPNTFDHLLFSFHGIPVRHLTLADPTKTHCTKCVDCCQIDSVAHATCYRHQCFQTMGLVTKKLNLARNKFSFSFQSRLGRKEWLQPYTSEHLAALAYSGVKDLCVVCPAFTSDCLETLEEIEIEGKEIFMEAGGNSFTLIPCLNDHPDWVEAVKLFVHQS